MRRIDSAGPRIAVVTGTRPEAIAPAPVLRGLEERGAADPAEQHAEMLDQMLSELGIRSNHDLPELTARLVVGFGEVAGKEEPDTVIDQDDTTTAFGAVLTALYTRVLRAGPLPTPSRRAVR